MSARPFLARVLLLFTPLSWCWSLRFRFGNKSGRRSAAKLLTNIEARRIAVNIAKLPELFGPNVLRQA